MITSETSQVLVAGGQVFFSRGICPTLLLAWLKIILTVRKTQIKTNQAEMTIVRILSDPTHGN